ncbi:MAG: twin-arginine translocation signal domain-containing protein [Aridibacter famidurans]|nr:twin-arginine translocation signal domain-containing protein [Aridibacter famidurans]
MSDISRRKFIAKLGAAGAAGLLCRDVPAFIGQAAGKWSGDYHFLVIGDSLIAGQGLREEDRFYSLTREWLQEEIVGNGAKVVLKNKSHSGANVYLNERDRKALEDAERPLDEFFPSEVNFTFPSISKQVEVAIREYGEAGVDPKDVGLVMVSGGLTNITVKGIIDPFDDSDNLRRDIVKYCNGYMNRFLGEAGEAFPNAVIAVIGYYPMISPKSSTGMIYNSVLELYEIPGPLKPVMNNIFTKQFFKLLHKQMTKRSRIWAEGSDRELKNAVAAHNERAGKEQAVFVTAPIDESTCFATKRSLLWKMAKKGRSEDDLYDHRKQVCSESIDSVQDIDLEFKKRFCELAGLGHPNREGSLAYAESIKTTLRPMLLAGSRRDVSSSGLARRISI